MRSAALLLVCACAAPVKPAHFVADPGEPPEVPVTDRAVTTRGAVGIHAAGGRHIGAVFAHATGGGSTTDAVRVAARMAAAAGGTHIILRGAAVTQVAVTDLSHAEPSQDPLAGKPRFPDGRAGFTTRTRADDVKAIFEVYRVEPARWIELHEEMRPQPRPSGH